MFTIMFIHRWLAAGEVGKQIVGASTAILIFFALSGLYLRWPRNWASLKTWVFIDFSRRGRSLFWELHSIVGTWVLPFYLLAALTASRGRTTGIATPINDVLGGPAAGPAWTRGGPRRSRLKASMSQQAANARRVRHRRPARPNATAGEAGRARTEWPARRRARTARPEARAVKATGRADARTRATLLPVFVKESAASRRPRFASGAGRQPQHPIHPAQCGP